MLEIITELHFNLTWAMGLLGLSKKCGRNVAYARIGNL